MKKKTMYPFSYSATYYTSSIRTKLPLKLKHEQNKNDAKKC